MKSICLIYYFFLIEDSHTQGREKSKSICVNKQKVHQKMLLVIDSHSTVSIVFLELFGFDNGMTDSPILILPIKNEN